EDVSLAMRGALLGRTQARLRRCHVQSDLRRIAHGLPALERSGVGLTREDEGTDEPLERGVGHRWLAPTQHLTDRLVPDARDVVAVATGPQRPDRHLVLREGARLVRADDGGAP